MGTPSSHTLLISLLSAQEQQRIMQAELREQLQRQQQQQDLALPVLSNLRLLFIGSA